jgi:hypothetical protein
MGKKIVSRVVINKRTGQPMIFPSKKLIRANNPTLKFDKELFVELTFLKKKKK